MKIKKHLIALSYFVASLLCLNSSVASRYSPKNDSITIQCQLVNNLCHVTGSIGKISNLSLIVDTGSSMTVIDSPLVKKLGVAAKSNGKTSGPGVGGSNDYKKYDGLEINIGSLRLANQSVISLPLKYISEKNGYPADGILGSNIFLNYVVEIDYLSKKIRLSKQENWQPFDHGEKIPFVLLGNVPIVQASVKLANGEAISGNFLVDSGQAGVGLIIFDSFQNAHPQIMASTKLLPTNSAVVGGRASFLIGTIAGLQLGEHLIKKPLTAFTINAAGIYAHPGLAGAIGADVLARFDTTFDYSHLSIYLKPNASFQKAFKSK